MKGRVYECIQGRFRNRGMGSSKANQIPNADVQMQPDRWQEYNSLWSHRVTNLMIGTSEWFQIWYWVDEYSMEAMWIGIRISEYRVWYRIIGSEISGCDVGMVTCNSCTGKSQWLRLEWHCLSNLVTLMCTDRVGWLIASKGADRPPFISYLQGVTNHLPIKEKQRENQSNPLVFAWVTSETGHGTLWLKYLRLGKWLLSYWAYNDEIGLSFEWVSCDSNISCFGTCETIGVQNAHAITKEF